MIGTSSLAKSWGARSLLENVSLQLGGHTLLLVPVIWPGNGAGLAILRVRPAGACVVNVWAFAFGGNGIDLRAIQVDAVDST